MGRMHSGGKGISKSSLPYKRTPASWVKAKPVDVEDMVVKFAKKGLSPSQVLTNTHLFPLVLSTREVSHIVCKFSLRCLYIASSRVSQDMW